MKWITSIQQPTVKISCEFGNYTLMKGELIEHREIAELFPNIFKEYKEVTAIEYEAPKIISTIGEEKIELLPVPKIDSADYGVFEDFGDGDSSIFVLASPDDVDEEETKVIEEPKRKRGRPFGKIGSYKAKPTVKR